MLGIEVGAALKLSLIHILAVNKVDSFQKFGNDVYEFYNLGIGDPVGISAASRLGLGELLDAVVSHFEDGTGEEEEDERDVYKRQALMRFWRRPVMPWKIITDRNGQNVIGTV